MAKSYFFPRPIDQQRSWLVTYVQQLPTVGPGMGMTATEIADNIAAANDLIAAIDATNLAENAYKSAVEVKNAAVTATVSDIILPSVKRAKTSSTYTTAAGELLGIEGSETSFDPDSYRPSATAKVIEEDVKISFKKLGVDGVSIYSRIRASSDPEVSSPPTRIELASFAKLALDHHSPYVDNRPLSRAGTPEVREYYLRGIVDDVEIGLRSDIIRVVVGD